MRATTHTRSLGKLTVEVFQNADGSVVVNRTTELSDELGNMQLGMTDKEIIYAKDLRRKACAKVADFFLFGLHLSLRVVGFGVVYLLPLGLAFGWQS